MSPTSIEGIGPRPAPLRARVWAAIVDMSMMALPLLVLCAAAFLRMSGVPTPKLTTLFALGTLATLVIATAQVVIMGRAGRSYGKFALHLRVVRVTGGKPSFGAAGLMRTLLPGFLWIACPPFALLDVGVGLLRSDKRCLHDLFAGTMVVSE